MTIYNADEKTGSNENRGILSSIENELTHELRTPLIGILGFSELLMEDGSREDVSEMATKINECGTRLLEFIDVLFSSSANAGNHFKKSHEDDAYYDSEYLGLFRIELLNRFKNLAANGE